MKKLGELLVEREWLTRDQLTQALRHQQVFGGRLGSCLLELTLLSEDRLTKALSDQAGVPPATVDDLRVIPDGLLEQVPVKLACRVRAIPFERFGNALSIAVIDARDLVAQDELAFVTSKRLKVHVAPEVRVLEALEKHYSCPIEPRYSRIWDRLNRAKYLWQEETGAKARPGVEAPPAPTPSPMRPPAPPPSWEPAPPPPLETILRAAPPPAPAPVSVEPPPPEPPKKKRWMFGRGKSTEVKPPADMVAPEPAAPAVVARPAAAAPAPATPPPAASRVVLPPAPTPTPIQATPPSPAAVAPAPAIPPPVSTRPPAAPAAIPPPASPPAPVPTARRVQEDRETLPPAPTPTPVVERAAAIPASPAAPVAPPAPVTAEREAGDTTPVIVPKPAATLDDLEDRIGEVEERDDVAHAALSFFSRRFHRTLLFMVRGDTVAAWMGSGDNLDQRLFGEVEITFDEPSLFLNLREGSPFYRGPLPRLDTHQRLVRAWGGKYPRECLLLPVRIKKRLVAVVYLDGASEDLGGAGADVGELQKAATMLGRGLESFLVKRKRA
jgi:hypothetical protein